MGKGFKFSFKDKIKKNLAYVAIYDPPKPFKVTPIIRCSESISDKGKAIKCSEAFNIFCNNATFEEILRGLNSSADINWKEIESALSNLDSLTDRRFLELVRDYPFILVNTEVAIKLSVILEKAQEGTKEAKENLKDYLIPGHPGGKRFRPSLKNPGELIKKLAKYISKKYRDELGKEIINKAVRNWDRKTYDLSLKWGRASEKRICRLNMDDLRKLLLSPSRFADTLLITHLGISLKTLRNSAK